jgi:pSer/pThr/pTyr-binding forkhead associated (FHA) protein/Tfp pilus assembly protein PilF
MAGFLPRPPARGWLDAAGETLVEFAVPCQLVFLNGPRAGSSLRFEQTSFWIGRDPSCALAFDPTTEVKVSGRHAELTLAGDRYQIRDNHSTNGTFVNGQQVTEAPLHDGDVLELGRGGPQLRFAVERVPSCKLIVLTGSRMGQSLCSDRPSFWIGRDPACELAFDPHAETLVSGRHAEIKLVGDRYLIRDQSTNGTFLNGQQVTEAPLHDGDVLELGRGGPQLQFVLPDGPATRAPVPPTAPTPRVAAGAPSTAAPRRRRRLWPIFVGLALLLAVGGGLAFYLLVVRPRVAVGSDDNAFTAYRADPSSKANRERLARLKAGRALALLEAAREKRAVEGLQLALWNAYGARELCPENALYWFLLAQIHGENVDSPASLALAENAARQALQLAPTDQRIRLFLGQVLFREKYFASALDQLEKAVTADATLAQPTLISMMTVAYALDSLAERGEQFMSRFVAAQPASAPARLSLAVLLHHQGGAKDAAAYAELEKVKSASGASEKDRAYAAKLAADWRKEVRR